LTGCQGETELSQAVLKGQSLYGDLCSTCHGPLGEGGNAPKLRDWSRGESALVAGIAGRMPLGNPDKCDSTCAKSIASYILEKFKGPISCDAPATAPRRLRLLTRREYLATVTDLLGVRPTPVVGSMSARASACAPVPFRYAPSPTRTLKSVHVAGSFNQWAATVQGGGLALQYAQDEQAWRGTLSLKPGEYTYKFVLNESEWASDPGNPNRKPDGKGGENSLLVVEPCEGQSSASDGSSSTTAPMPLGFDPTQGFPPDLRPEGYLFDNSSSARVVSSVHGAEYQRAARELAKVASDRIALLAPCSNKGREECAQEFVEGFGFRAFRRPLKPAEVQRYRGLFLKGQDAKEGVALTVRAMLASPHFLYRSEVGEPQSDGSFLLTPFETASALSYMFWGTMPDSSLFEAAARGGLRSSEDLRKAAQRLLDSPRSRPQMVAFAGQWLGAKDVLEATKNGDVYPNFSPELRQSLLDETTTFFGHVFFDASHTVDELFTADYSFLNDKLATFYGISGVQGSTLQKTRLGTPWRSGLLGHGSILATTAHSDQTSPIRRGLFVRRHLLCQEFGTPPALAATLPKIDPKATTRERFKQHTTDPFCQSCHQYIDNLGFGFENFDAIGKYRSTENGVAVDAQGDMNDVEGLGTKTHAPFASLPELGKVLASSASAESCIVRQLYRFARGDKEAGGQVCSLRTLEESLKAHQGDLREVLLSVAQTPDFLVRR
jgi:hypothetical protein